MINSSEMKFDDTTVTGQFHQPARRLFRWAWALHRHEVMVLPQRLRAWGGALAPAALGNKGREQLQSLLNSLQAFSDRIQLGSMARSVTREQELLIDFRDWKNGVE